MLTVDVAARDARHGDKECFAAIPGFSDCPHNLVCIYLLSKVLETTHMADWLQVKEPAYHNDAVCSRPFGRCLLLKHLKNTIIIYYHLVKILCFIYCLTCKKYGAKMVVLKVTKHVDPNSLHPVASHPACPFPKIEWTTDHLPAWVSFYSALATR